MLKVNYSKILLYSLIIFIISSSIFFLKLEKNNFILFFTNFLFFIPLFFYLYKSTFLNKEFNFPLFQIIVLMLFLNHFLIFYFDYYNYLFFSNSKLILIDEDSVIKFLIYNIFFFLFFLILFYFTLKFALKKIKFRIKYFFNFKNISYSYIGYFFLFIFIFIEVNYYNSYNSIFSNLKINFLYFSFLIFFIKRKLKIFDYFAFILVLLSFVFQTFLMPLLYFSLILITFRWSIYKNFNVIILIITILMTVFLILTKSLHRHNISVLNYNNNSYSHSYINNINLFLNYTIKQKKLIIDKNHINNVDEFDFSIPKYNFANNISGLKLRISMPNITFIRSYILYENNISIKYDGETIKHLFYSFVPRILWKNKPIFDYQNSFGRKIGVLNEKDFTTSVNIPFLTEIYLNFDYWESVIYVFLYALLIVVIEFLINSFYKINKLFFMIFVSSTFSMCYVDSSAVFMFNSFFYKIIILVVICFILNNLKKLYKC